MKTAPHLIDVEIGRRLRTRRTTVGVSQEKLAEALGITFQQIQKYESGRNRLSGSRMVEACRFLVIKPEDFLRDIDEHAPEAAETPVLNATSGAVVRHMANMKPAMRTALVRVAAALAEAGEGAP